MDKKNKTAVLLILALIVLGAIALFFILVSGVALWQIGAFEPISTQSTAIGFSKLKPLNPGDMQATSDSFDAMFINAVGGTINITGISSTVISPEDAAPCTEWMVGSPGGRQVTNPDKEKTFEVRQGEVFTVTGTGCSFPGSTYQMDLTIEYSVNIGGFVASRAESGRISGPIVVSY